MKKHPLATTPLKPWAPFDSQKYRTQADLTQAVTESHKRLVQAIEHLPFFFAFMSERLPSETSTNENLKELIRTYIHKRLEAANNPPKSTFLNLGNECLALREQIDQILPNFWDMIIDFDITQLSDEAFEKASQNPEFGAEVAVLKHKIATRKVLDN